MRITMNSVDFDFYVDDENVIRWNTNGVVPPDECLGVMVVAGLVTERQVTISKKVRQNELMAFLNEYRKAQATRTPDQRHEARLEARSAFGEGVEVVNVFTGERYRT